MEDPRHVTQPQQALRPYSPAGVGRPDCMDNFGSNRSKCPGSLWVRYRTMEQ